MLTLNRSNLTYIPLNDIIIEVKASLSSFFESGLDISEAIYIPQVRSLLRKLGPRIKAIDSEIISIDQYKGPLPRNFYKMLSAIGSFNKQIYVPNIDVNTVNIIEDFSIHKINGCELNVCTNEYDEYMHVMQKTKEGEWVQYVDFVPLQVAKTSTPNVDDYSPNLHIKNSEHQISFDRNNIMTNFPSGYVYMEYYSLLEDSEGNIVIPSDEIIQDAFTETIRLAILEYLLFNNSQDISNLYKLQNEKTKFAVKMAVDLIKTPEVSDVLRLKQWMINRYRKFQNLNY